MHTRIIASVVACLIPATVSAGPLADAVARAARTTALAQQPDTSTGRGTRFWTSLALIAGGGVLLALGGLEIGDDESGPDDGEDFDESDDGEDSDGANKALMGAGAAAAALGGVLLFTGRSAGPRVSPEVKGFAVRHTVRF